MIDNIGINNLEIRCLKEFFILNFLVYCLCFPYVYQFTVCDLETMLCFVIQDHLGFLVIVFSLFFEIQVYSIISGDTPCLQFPLFTFFLLLSVTNKLKKKIFQHAFSCYCATCLNSSIQVCRVMSLLAQVKCRYLYCFTV